MICCYDLAVELLTFDFYGWLVRVKAMGATEVVFDTRAINGDPAKRRRFETMLAPGPALAGLPWREGIDGHRLAPGCSRMGALVFFARRAPGFARLNSVLPAGDARYTVTLRNQRDSVWRNSNVMAWTQFAAEIGARVIDDYDDVAIDLHERLALYAGAELNLGIVCGPLVLCSLTTYPCLMFGWGRGQHNLMLAKYGIGLGESAPWCGPDQYILWADDDLDEIRRWFTRWRTRKAALAQHRERAHA